MDDLSDDISGLVSICLLPESDESSEYVYNESYEYKESDKIIIVFCAIRTRFSYLIASIRTQSS